MLFCTNKIPCPFFVGKDEGQRDNVVVVIVVPRTTLGGFLNGEELNPVE